MPSDLNGVVLRDRYQIGGLLSEELLGRVYRGRDLHRQVPVQIKVLHEHIATDEKRFGRFLREVKTTSMVRHINTIEVLDTGSDSGLHWIVMEDFPARSLEEELALHPTLPIERVCQIAAQIAGAIGAAHQESITHRALSPRNILLLTNTRRGDFVKVRDFGLAKLEEFDTNEEASHLTEAGVRVGNTAYMAPEYIENDRYHPKGDLYALGCLMTHMLTGEPPYTGRAATILGDHVTAAVPHPNRKREMPDWLDDLVVELLAKEPARRPGAYQVVARLEENLGRRLGPPALDGEPGAGPDPTEPRAVPWAILTAVAAGMVLIVGALGVVAIAAVVLVMGWTTDEPASVTTTNTRPFDVEAPAQPRPAPAPFPPAPEPPPAAPAAPAAAPSTAPTPKPKAPVVQEAPASTPGVHVFANRRALVYVDSRPKGMTPMDFQLAPGIHRIGAMLPNEPETRQEQKVRVRENGSYEVSFTF